MDPFTSFEHTGWQRVAHRYDRTWASSTRQFIPPLLDAAEVGENMNVLDLGCGPGYVSALASERGATATGLDFSSEMVAIARKRCPAIEFREGDAQNLPFGEGEFDRIVANFALLHVARPQRVFAEAFRVLKPGGRFAFTTWAHRDENPFVRIVDDAVSAHADLEVDLPPGPPYYLFRSANEFRRALAGHGFDGATLKFRVHTIQWEVPDANYIFEAERQAGVRTAGLLARQRPETLSAILATLEINASEFATPSGLSVPKAAYVVAVAKS